MVKGWRGGGEWGGGLRKERGCEGILGGRVAKGGTHQLINIRKSPHIFAFSPENESFFKIS